jgi:hypothetical protein
MPVNISRKDYGRKKANPDLVANPKKPKDVEIRSASLHQA